MHKTLEITRLIHENFLTALLFAFGRPVISKVIDDRFHGEWKYLNKTVHGLAEVAADRALLAMATQLRVLDDAEGLSEYYRQVGSCPLGELTKTDDSREPLYFRDMTNKIMHAASFQWDVSAPDDPKIICLPHDPTRWKTARVDIVALMGMIGNLMY